ncbi:hypothetical protein [Mucilaginibacter antarcticus]|uniref:hypothetical protein n=1 Tax=Mucilaginibacter antarcticus TaxID=1855725 RepID=UPI00363033EA
MKHERLLLSGLIIMLAVLINRPVQAQQGQAAKPTIYRLDTKKSKLLWTAPKNRHNGFILFTSGNLSNVTDGWPTTGAFNINMTSMRSTSETTAAETKKVDGKLKSDEFFL